MSDKLTKLKQLINDFADSDISYQIPDHRFVFHGPITNLSDSFRNLVIVGYFNNYINSLPLLKRPHILIHVYHLLYVSSKFCRFVLQHLTHFSKAYPIPLSYHLPSDVLSHNPCLRCSLAADQVPNPDLIQFVSELTLSQSESDMVRSIFNDYNLAKLTELSLIGNSITVTNIPNSVQMLRVSNDVVVSHCLPNLVHLVLLNSSIFFDLSLVPNLKQFDIFIFQQSAKTHFYSSLDFNNCKNLEIFHVYNYVPTTIDLDLSGLSKLTKVFSLWCQHSPS
ncbi:hypothetical protein GEMRC1_012942 [Eukaryota sp. GEM-RC1]